MHQITPVALAGMLLFVATGTTAAEPPALEQENDRISYSLGHQIGSDLRRQGVAPDQAALRRGIEDGQGGSTPLLPQADMDERLVRLKGEITEDMHAEQTRRVQERRADAERKRRAANEFLAANAKAEGVVTAESGLQYRIISTGTGTRPSVRDRVTIQYRGTRIDGSEYDNSRRRRGPVTVAVADTILGIREALLQMQPGAKWLLFIPPDLAYGRTSPLAHQAVIVELELLAIDADTAATAPGHDARDANVQAH